MLQRKNYGTASALIISQSQVCAKFMQRKSILQKEIIICSIFNSQTKSNLRQRQINKIELA